jgi:hypothetical protein
MVPIKSDKEVNEDELKNRHLLLIGRPDSNPLVERFRARLPITFGTRSFQVRQQRYAHAGSAVIAAAENPLNARYSLVVIAGLGTEATVHAPTQLYPRGRAGEVLVLPHEGKHRTLVMPAADLVKELEQSAKAK